MQKSYTVNYIRQFNITLDDLSFFFIVTPNFAESVFFTGFPIQMAKYVYIGKWTGKNAL